MDDRVKLIIDPNFMFTLEQIKKLNISFPVLNEDTIYHYEFNNSEHKIEVLENDDYPSTLSSIRGREYFESLYAVCAYDESIKNMASLEGITYVTSHCLLLLTKEAYYPSCYISIDFITNAKTISELGENFTLSSEEDSEIAYKKRYIEIRNNFIMEYLPDKIVFIIDGPLIGNQISSKNIHLSLKLIEKGIIPIFVVKNSTSTLIVDCDPLLKNNYNSDIHWAYKTLKVGDRSRLYKYRDMLVGHEKIFCYLKSFESSPIRIEFIPAVLDIIPIQDIINMLYYFILVQGTNNPQPRPVAIAEIYARECNRYIDIYEYIIKCTSPTFNETRGMNY